MNFQEIVDTLYKINITPEMLGTHFESLDEIEDTDEEGKYFFIMDDEKIVINPERHEVENKIKERLGNFEFKHIHDDSENLSTTVVFFNDHNVYIKIEGWWSSWSGKNFQKAKFIECVPVEEIVINYEAKI